MRAELLLMELASLSNTPQRDPWILLPVSPNGYILHNYNIVSKPGN